MKVKCVKCGRLMNSDEKFCGMCGCRYYSIDTNVYVAENCPVVVQEQKILQDADNTSVQIVFLNNCEMQIAACKVKARCFDQFGEEVASTIIKYMDLEVDPGVEFGDSKVTVLESDDTRRLDLIVEKVIFENGSSWDWSDGCKWVEKNEEFNDSVVRRCAHLEQEEKQLSGINLYNQLLELREKWRLILFGAECEVGEFRENQKVINMTYDLLKSSEDNKGLVDQYLDDLSDIIDVKEESGKRRIADINLFIPENVTKLNTDVFDLYYEDDTERHNADIVHSFWRRIGFDFGSVFYRLHDGIRSIESNAFCSRRLLEMNRILEGGFPKELESIKDCPQKVYGFEGLPDTLTEIGPAAFYGVEFYENDEVLVTSIVIPKSVRRIGRCAFVNSVKKLVLSINTMLDDNALYGIDEVELVDQYDGSGNIEVDDYGRIFAYDSEGILRLLWCPKDLRLDTLVADESCGFLSRECEPDFESNTDWHKYHAVEKSSWIDNEEYRPEFNGTNEHVKFLVIEESETESRKYDSLALDQLPNLTAVWIKKDANLYCDKDYNVRTFEASENFEEWARDACEKKHLRDATYYQLSRKHIKIFSEWYVPFSVVKETCQNDIILEKQFGEQCPDRQSLEAKLGEFHSKICTLRDQMSQINQKIQNLYSDNAHYNNLIHEARQGIKDYEAQKAYNVSRMNAFNKNKTIDDNQRLDMLIAQLSMKINEYNGYITANLSRVASERAQYDNEIKLLQSQVDELQVQMEVLFRLWYRIDYAEYKGSPDEPYSIAPYDEDFYKKLNNNSLLYIPQQ